MEIKNGHAVTMLSEYASLLSLMRNNVTATFDLQNPRVADFHQALEIAWAGAMLLVMQERETDMDNDIAEVA